jgi:uncharacterized repeat protein (TIGR03803 family)
MIKHFGPFLVAALALTACGGTQLPVSSASGATKGRANSGSYSVLYSFGQPYDGEKPQAGLINLNGTLYGTTYNGGKYGSGSVFSLSTSGAEKVLYSFNTVTKDDDGAHPSAALLAVDGLLYGTTEYGGVVGDPNGTVFTVSTAGNERVLYRFRGYYRDYHFYDDGANPVASLIDVKGKLYGTTYSGGAGQFYGTVFRISTSGRETVLHSFAPYPDGAGPAASLLDVKGMLYGTTVGGGSLGSFGSGTVYRISTGGAEQVIYAFGYYSADGDYPDAALVDVGGTLYGTARQGGSVGNGTVFSITTGGDLSLLYSFDTEYDGNQPNAPLLKVNRTLYGTTTDGGSYGKGTVFTLTLSGKEKVLHSFGYGSDGAAPVAGLVDVNGTLYGTTSTGGTYGAGTVFSLRP